MSAPTNLEHWREIVTGLFPFLARFRVRPLSEGGALELRSANGRIELEGGGRAASGVGHLVVRLFWHSVGATLYASSSTAPPYVWAPIATGIIPPTTADAGTAITIAEGSAKVQIDA